MNGRKSGATEGVNWRLNEFIKEYVIMQTVRISEQKNDQIDENQQMSVV